MGLTLLALYIYIKSSIITDNCITFIKDQIKAFNLNQIYFWQVEIQIDSFLKGLFINFCDLQVSWAGGRWLDKLRRLPEGEQCPPPWNDAVYVYTPTVPLEEQTIATSIAYLAPTKYKNHMDIMKSSLMFYIFSSTTGIYRLLVIIITDFIFSPPTYFYQFVN